MLFLTESPLWVSAIILILVPTAISTAAPFLVRRLTALDMLRENNEIVGFKFAVVGIVHPVLLAFAVIVVWEKFNDADGVVSGKRARRRRCYWLGRGFGGGEGAALDKAVVAYLTATIRHEWPAIGEAGRARRPRRRWTGYTRRRCASSLPTTTGGRC